MAGSILTYLKEVTQSFEEVPFNEVDSLILCRLMYLKMAGIVPAMKKGQPIQFMPFTEIAIPENREALLGDTRNADSNGELIDLLLASPRYKDLAVGEWVDVLSFEFEMQYASAVITPGKGIYYIAYRGTDETLVGWKEDVTLGFTEPVASQMMAGKYIRRAAEKLEGDFYVGGHSKGGNLATYAGMIAKPALQERIILVYNHDGPGFKKEVRERYHYDRIRPKVKKYLPRESMVGMLMEDVDDCAIVCCDGFGLQQHSPMLWHVEGTQFERADKLMFSYQLMDNAITEWVQTLDDDELDFMAEEVFAVLGAADKDTLIEISKDPLYSLREITRAMGEMDPENRTQMEELMGRLMETLSKKSREEWLKRTEEMREKTSKVVGKAIMAARTGAIGLDLKVKKEEALAARFLKRLEYRREEKED